MRVTRRTLLEILAAAIGVGSAAYAVGPLRTRYHQLVVPVLDNAPTGSIDSQTMRALLAATETLIDYPLDADHYADFFRWRSENLPGHRALYERFATTVNHAAARSSGCDFAACEAAARRDILAKGLEARAARGRLDRLRVSVRDRDWLLFDRYIVRPITLVFAATDAWRLAGYDAWPGTPRGLENYVRGPSVLRTPRPRSLVFREETG